MGCVWGRAASYTAPSERLFPRATNRLNVRGWSAETGGPSDLPIAGVGSISMVGLAAPAESQKANQDAFAADACLGADPLVGLFSVMDGHGPHGERIASKIARELGSHVAAAACSSDGSAPPAEAALRRGFLQQHVALLRAADIDCSLSGAACVALMLEQRDGIGARAITANVGDARCVAGVQSAPCERIRAHEWTTDHTPEHPDEARRLCMMGARIAPWTEDKHGRHPVQRVWLPDADTPGKQPARHTACIRALDSCRAAR